MNRLLVLAETDGTRILPTTASALAFAQGWSRASGGAFDLLCLLGAGDVSEVVDKWRHWGAEQVFVTQRPEFEHLRVDQAAAAVVAVIQQSGATALAGLASTSGRATLAYAAGLLDWPMVSDVMDVHGSAAEMTCHRPMYAGQVIATVQVAGPNAVFSVRVASWGKLKKSDAVSAITAKDIDPHLLPPGANWVSREQKARERPDLAEARVVVAGGRPLRDAATFERLVGGLADRLGGAAGASGGAVGAGIAPNELLIGQTGKSVAPDLYIAAGISGSDQHVGGIRDSRIIVAINQNPSATIFQEADYGLVADIHAALPELTDKLLWP